MSKIEDIVKIEDEAKATLSEAKKAAAQIKRQGQADAQKVVSDALANKRLHELSQKNHINEKISNDELALKAQFEALQAQRLTTFKANKNNTIEWIVNKILG